MVLLLIQMKISFMILYFIINLNYFGFYFFKNIRQIIKWNYRFWNFTCEPKQRKIDLHWELSFQLDLIILSPFFYLFIYLLVTINSHLILTPDHCLPPAKLYCLGIIEWKENGKIIFFFFNVWTQQRKEKGCDLSNNLKELFWIK